jgi:HSP20 family protein
MARLSLQAYVETVIANRRVRRVDPIRRAAMTLAKRKETELQRGEKATWPFPGIFEDFDSMFDRLRGAPASALEWARRPFPKMDVLSKNGGLLVKTELPGVEKGDIHVSVDHDSLVIEGERRHEKEEEKGEVYRRESSYGHFYRRLPLGFEPDPAKIEASFKNGVLELTIPVPKEASREKHEVRIS